MAAGSTTETGSPELQERHPRASAPEARRNGEPTHEVINPTRKDIHHEYERGFRGMTDTPVTLDQLTQAREELISEVIMRMPASHRQFLIAFERGEPEWTILGIDHAATLPAVRWKQQNLDKLDNSTRSELAARLEDVLG